MHSWPPKFRSIAHKLILFSRHGETLKVGVVRVSFPKNKQKLRITKIANPFWFVLILDSDSAVVPSSRFAEKHDSSDQFKSYRQPYLVQL